MFYDTAINLEIRLYLSKSFVQINETNSLFFGQFALFFFPATKSGNFLDTGEKLSNFRASFSMQNTIKQYFNTVHT